MRGVKDNKADWDYQIRQQILTSWHPLPTIKSTICIFLTLSIFFLCFGIILFILSEDVQEVSIRYESCPIHSSNYCDIILNIPSPMVAPVYVYYGLENYYQNHRRYAKSKDALQLAGANKGVGDLEECYPIITNADLGYTLSVSGQTLVPTEPANPCGLIAKSLFNDTFSIIDSGSNLKQISSQNIAWPSDKENRFKNLAASNWRDIQWTDKEDERFMVWMRIAAHPKFRKLWGIIHETLLPGQYTVKIINKFPVNQFGGQKSFILSTANAFGGKNYFLAYCYLIVGSFCFVASIILIVVKKKYPSKFEEIKLQ